MVGIRFESVERTFDVTLVGTSIAGLSAAVAAVAADARVAVLDRARGAKFGGHAPYRPSLFGVTPDGGPLGMVCITA